MVTFDGLGDSWIDMYLKRDEGLVLTVAWLFQLVTKT